VTPEASPTDPHSELESRLSLADWRRRVSELYAEVRARASEDPRAAHAFWIAEREALFREHPQSPLPAERRADFRARHWPWDPAMRFEVVVQPPVRREPGEPALALPHAEGVALDFSPIGRVTAPFPEGERDLGLFWMSGYTGGLFLPFRDATNGRETYGAGRYALDAGKSADLGGDAARGTIVLDFNFAYQPSCAWDPQWACPLAPPENRLDIAVRAGEQLA
jgi:hypothetical protein